MASQQENSFPRLVALKSNSHYTVITYQNTNIDTLLSNSVSDVAIRLLHEIEGSGLALPCEPSDFQFDIDVPVFSTVTQGDSVTIPVKVTLVKGESVPVSLSTTTWQDNLGIYGQFVQNTVTPTQSTSLVVQTRCSTPPDNYQFYVNGIATSGKVPASSADMVTVTVEAKPNCVSQNNQQIGQQTLGSTNTSMDTAYQLATQGKYQEVLPYLDNVLQQEPDNVLALYNKANALEHLEKYEDALEYYNKVLQIEPEDTDTLNGIAHSTFQLGRYEESIPYYDKLLEKNPNDVNMLLGKGAALSNSGKYQESLPYFDKVLEIEPENTYAQQNKKVTLEKINTQETPTSDQGGGCLIATAMYGSELAPQVQQLRELRDNSLLQTASGTSFMSSFNPFYYSFSPTVADWERENPAFKELVKVSLTPMISSLSILNYVDMDSEVSVLGYGISLILLNVGMYFVAPGIVVHQIRKKF
jgi:tetratricopeptide (TPR) repeat protein